MSHFKNVDEDALLKIPGVKYVPLVGKVSNPKPKPKYLTPGSKHKVSNPKPRPKPEPKRVLKVLMLGQQFLTVSMPEQVTVSMLERNLIRLIKQFQLDDQ